MEENGRRTLVKEYRERNTRWTDKALSQMSYFNDLLLTLSLGFVTFSYKDLITANLQFSISNPNTQLTLWVSSLIIMLLAIFFGLSNALNRLADHRITRYIIQIRLRMYEHSLEKMGDSTPEKYKCRKRRMLAMKIFKDKYPKITIEMCKTFNMMSIDEKKKIRNDFNELRDIAHNLGVNSWKSTYFQVWLFSISLVFFFLGIIT